MHTLQILLLEHVLAVFVDVISLWHHSRVYSSLKYRFYPQMKTHSSKSWLLSQNWHLNDDFSPLLSQVQPCQPWHTTFYMHQFTFFLFSRTFCILIPLFISDMRLISYEGSNRFFPEVLLHTDIIYCVTDGCNPWLALWPLQL